MGIAVGIDIKPDSVHRGIHAQHLRRRRHAFRAAIDQPRFVFAGRKLGLDETIIRVLRSAVTRPEIRTGPKTDAGVAVKRRQLGLHGAGHGERGERGVGRRNRIGLVRVTRCAAAEIPGDQAVITDGEQLVEGRITTIVDHGESGRSRKSRAATSNERGSGKKGKTAQDKTPFEPAGEPDIRPAQRGFHRIQPRAL
jgi:hypothetical protein